ncbi:hypothetical protein FRB94_013129 [Tulasnella sp. JGI-2019a]|nr:hypothetical protein FRB94_013129 [Tulasnella sp. JGI-2019a]
MNESTTDSFGVRRNFWLKYDTFADKFDKDMLLHLNTNLDVLLIFAGLFSGVNTAFIVVALTALSANPADETNHLLRLLVMNVSNHTLSENDLTPQFAPGRAAVRQNCTFFASLCCSLLAAAGAVLAKQWLQRYERTGQTGTADQQALRRTEKFVGAETWGLQPAVKTLGTLLVISLTLFFVALIDYLWTINETVAIVVLAFAATGGLLYLLIIVLATVFPACPFQTGPSTALRQLYLMIQRWIYSPNIKSRWMNNIPFDFQLMYVFEWIFEVDCAWSLGTFLIQLVLGLSFFAFITPLIIFPTYIVFALIVPLLRQLIQRNDNLGRRSMSSLHAHSAILMLADASNADIVTIVADNIPLISDIEAAKLFAASVALEILLSQLQKSVLDIQHGNEGADLTNALTLARAVVHIVFADPRRSANAVLKCVLDLDELGTKTHIQPIPLELNILLRCAQTLCGLRSINYFTTTGRITRDFGTRVGGFSWAAALKDVKVDNAAKVLQGEQSGSILWLHHCTIIAAYNRWDEEVMGDLVRELSELFLFKGLEPNPVYLSRVMDALLAILRWYPLWGRRNGHPSLNDSANLKSAWTLPECRPLSIRLLETLDAFSSHYATEDPGTFPTFLCCQQRLLSYVNALHESYDEATEVCSASSSTLSFARQMHYSLNSNVECLLTIDLSPPLTAFEEEVVLSEGEPKSCRSEVVRTLQHLLLTSTTRESINPADLTTTAHLALRVSTITEKEQLLQGILYSVSTEVFRSWPRDEFVVESHHNPLRKRQMAGSIMASSLRLYTWFHPAITTDQSWIAFESFLRLLASGGTLSQPSAPTNAPEARDTVIQIVRGNDPLQFSCLGLGLLWLTSKMKPGHEMSQQIDRRRLVDWFTRFMGQVQKHEAKDEEGRHWTTIDKKCAGVLFLNAWGEMVDAGSPTSQPIDWTSPDTVEAFATWLSDYSGQELVEIELDGVIIIQMPIPRRLVDSFVEHAGSANGEAAQKFRLQSILRTVPLAGHNPRGDVSNTTPDGEVKQAAGNVVSDMDCEWCNGASRCMHCGPVS